MKKLPAYCNHFAVPLGTSFVMTFLVSGVATFRALGMVDGVLARWMTSWMISWAIAFPTMYFMLPVVRHFLSRVIDEK